MNRESKVLIGVGALALVGLFAAMSTSPFLGVLIILGGLLGGVIYLRVTQPDQTDPFADARSVADETNVGNITPAEPLAPWSPEGGLGAWSPPADPTPTYDPPAYDPPAYDAPAYDPPAYDPPTHDRRPTAGWTRPRPISRRPMRPRRMSRRPTSGRRSRPPTGTTAAGTSRSRGNRRPRRPPPRRNPLDDLVGLDHLDPVAEVVRIDEREAAMPAPGESIFDGRELDIHGNAVNEAVTGADDIMAASQATELHLADGEQTELQKLLAKVQIRLSAYE